MRDWDMNHEHPTVYPATFDAWTGNNHGTQLTCFTGTKIQILT